MNNNKPGISILVCVLLTSSLLLVCMGVWKTTAYLVDFAVQKQVYIQNRYSIEGIMRLAIKDVSAHWNELDQILQQHANEVIYSIKNLTTTIEHLKNCSSNITVERNTSDMFQIKVVLLQEASPLLHAQCNLVSISNADSKGSFRVQDWYVGA